MNCFNLTSIFEYSKEKFLYMHDDLFVSNNKKYLDISSGFKNSQIDLEYAHPLTKKIKRLLILFPGQFTRGKFPANSSCFCKWRIHATYIHALCSMLQLLMVIDFV